MKTLKYLCIAILAGIFLFAACTKDEVVPSQDPQNTVLAESRSDHPSIDQNLNWTDNFSNSECLAQRWNLYGYPQPSWVLNACGRKGLFLNNGVYPQGSYAVSDAPAGDICGYTVESEVCINVLDNEGIVVSPEIGVTRYPDSPESGISMRLMYIGNNVPGIPREYENKTYVVMKVLVRGGSYIYSGDYTFPVNISSGSWHKLQIRVEPMHFVSFILDNAVIWKPGYQLDPTMLNRNHVVLGYVSPDNKSKAYHDYVRVLYPPYN